MYFFADDLKTTSDSHVSCHDIFCYGGYLIKKENIKHLEQLINETKIQYEIPIDMPIKWNFKDNRIRKYYEQKGKSELLSKIIEKSYEIRKTLLFKVQQSGIKIIISGFRELRSEQDRQSLFEWSFTNILQRIPFEQPQESNFINIILDWEQEDKNLFMNCFSHPYYHGKGLNNESFLSYCLERIQQSLPYISFSGTLYNPFLQLVDIIIGSCGAFLDYVFKNKDQRLAQEIFPFVIPMLRGYGMGDIFSWGLLIKPIEDLALVRDKFREMENLLSRSG